MKKILLIFIIITEIAFSNTKIITRALVNNLPITDIDIINEIKIINILNNEVKLDNNLKTMAIQNLINDILKDEEINKNKIKIDEDIIKKNYNAFLEEIAKKNINIENNLKKIIYNKIKLENSWKSLVANKFSWKVNININEINKIIEEYSKKNNDEIKISEYREKLILIEKNKKMEVYENNYLKLLRKNAIIKIF